MNTPTQTPRTDEHEQKLRTFRNATRTFANDADKELAMKEVPVSWDDFARTLERELADRHAEYTKALNRRVDVENTLLRVATGKRGPLTPEECRTLATQLGTSPA